ncbi:MAG TPA: sigma 54-interacting transcriptional regulator [Blastocatellia bacterium]|nr:sigma 54-interacting transcriptional regulator [Blastocatellia bacterium]
MQPDKEISSDLTQSRLIELYEAREEILSRVHPALSSVIDVDRFLQATVNEVGKRLGVDRVNIVMPTREGGFRVSYEYRADDQLRSGVGVNIPDYLIPTDRMREWLPQARPYAVNDTSEAPIWIRTACQLIGTRSILIVPFVFNQELLGVMALHYCYSPHEWTEFETGLVSWLGQQITIGLIYTRLYAEKEKEVEITKLLLEISNEINTRNDFSEITAFVIDKALELLRADYGCIGVLDTAEEQLHFEELRSRRGFDLRKSVEARFRGARSIRLPDHPLVREMIAEGSVLKLEHSRQSLLARYLLSNIIKGESALIAPITVRDRTFGIVGLVWHNEDRRFSNYETQLLTGISTQLGVALEKDRLAAEVIRLKRELNDVRSGERIIGSSAPIRRAIEMALSVADSQTTVLLQGESGTGKELIASLIQFNSGRASRPFVKINCGAIPQALLETELFGHERGAFTDARSRRIGRFEEASGGTLFLDEIGEMSLAAQVSLLRVLQDGEFTRVGGTEVIRTDVRVIAATNKDLEREIAEGRFRRDLYYRLNVYPIHLPPLRERPEDIYPLVAHFIDRYQQRSGRRVQGISDRALNILKGYSWPGNVRELENCIERAVIVAAGRLITEHDLPDNIRAQASVGQSSLIELSIPTPMEDVERRVIEQTLIHTSGDKAKAARLLGIGRKTLYRKLEQYKDQQGHPADSE